MDYGKNLLKKYGWKEGSGLGKNSDGITKPIRASLKFDKAGLGEDKSKEFTDLWWQRAFNEAASNIEVNTEGDNVTIGVKDDDAVEITPKPYFSKNLSKSLDYYNFIKKSVLSASRETYEEFCDEKPEKPAPPKLNEYPYEEWFNACEGLTAHKGARHGLTLSGKLYRIEQQEKELMAKFEQAQKYLSDHNFLSPPPAKRKKRPALEADTESVNNDHHSSKKKNKKDKKGDNELPVVTDSALDTTIKDLMLPKEKKKRKTQIAEERTQTWISESAIQKTAKKEKLSTNSIGDNSHNIIKKKHKVKKFANKSTMI